MHDNLLAVFTGILALAVALQTMLFWWMYKAIRRLTAYLDGMSGDLRKNIELISVKVDEGVKSVKSVAEGMKPIQERLADTTDIIRSRVSEVDHFLAETTDAFRLEILRIQETVQLALQKTEQTVEFLHQSVVAPIHELNALHQAVRVATDVFFRRRRNPSISAQDEEMFI